MTSPDRIAVKRTPVLQMGNTPEAIAITELGDTGRQEHTVAAGIGPQHRRQRNPSGPPEQTQLRGAKYSTHKGRKVESIGRLARVIETPAPHLFQYKCVTAWAIPPMKGGAGKRSTDMIVLPAEFYDMSTWENDGRPEQTRRRWRGGIRKSLEALVDQGLIRAGEILREEDLIMDSAA